jgi:hypothetical protein
MALDATEGEGRVPEVRPPRFRYVLHDHTPVPASSIVAWAAWFEHADRHVALTTIARVTVSTVFLSIDHNVYPERPPLLFETMVFGGALNGEMDRYSTWTEAEDGHATMVARVRAQDHGLAHEA